MYYNNHAWAYNYLLTDNGIISLFGEIPQLELSASQIKSGTLLKNYQYNEIAIKLISHRY
jgi:hypothetical protein